MRIHYEWSFATLWFSSWLLRVKNCAHPIPHLFHTHRLFTLAKCAHDPVNSPSPSHSGLQTRVSYLLSMKKSWFLFFLFVCFVFIFLFYWTQSLYEWHAIVYNQFRLLKVFLNVEKYRKQKRMFSLLLFDDLKSSLRLFSLLLSLPLLNR